MEEKNIVLTYAKISTGDTSKISAAQLRGYLGYLFIQDTEFHHHDSNPYRYPLIQYKKIRNGLIVLGIGDYSRIILEKLPDLKEIILPNSKVPVTNVEFTTAKHKITNDISQYEFQTPWIALNTKNYSKFKSLDKQFQKRFLEDILVGNILSMLKGVDIRIDYRLYIQIKWHKEIPVVAHKHGFSGFFAKFATNVSLPKHIGLGKSVSKGFGDIVKVNDH